MNHDKKYKKTEKTSLCHILHPMQYLGLVSGIPALHNFHLQMETMEKFLECHCGYCWYKDLGHLRNSFCFTQVQFSQTSHIEGTCVTFLDAAECRRAVPIAILASPEGCWVVAQPQLPTPVPGGVGLRLRTSTLI